MFKLMRSAMFLGLLVPFAGANAQQQLPNYVCGSELPIEQPPDAPVSFHDLVFFMDVFHPYDAMEMTNKSEKEVQDFLIGLEMIDENGNYILSVPAFNNDKNGQIPFDVSFRSWLTVGGDYEKPMPPHATSRKVLLSQFAFLTCPASARVSMIKLRYADKSEYKFSARGLNIPAVLLDPSFDHPGNLASWSTLTLTGLVTINSEGHASLEYLDSGPLELQQWLEKEVQNWKFSAAIADGRPALQGLPFMLVMDN